MVNCTKNAGEILSLDKWKIIAYFGTRSYNLEVDNQIGLRICKQRGEFEKRCEGVQGLIVGCPPARGSEVSDAASGLLKGTKMQPSDSHTSKVTCHRFPTYPKKADR